MTSEGQAQTAREFISAFNDGSWERISGVLAPGCVYEEPATKRRVSGRDQVMEIWRAWKRAVPDSKGTVTGSVAGGDRVALEVRWEGTMTGPFGDFRPTGKHKTSLTAIFYFFKGRQITEFRHYFDSLELFQLLGVNLPVQGVNVAVPGVQRPVPRLSPL